MVAFLCNLHFQRNIVQLYFLNLGRNEIKVILYFNLHTTAICLFMRRSTRFEANELHHALNFFAINRVTDILAIANTQTDITNAIQNVKFMNFTQF